MDKESNEILGVFNQASPSISETQFTNSTTLVDTSFNAGTDALFSWSSYFGSIAMLLFILLALFATLWFVKKYNKSNFLSRHLKNIPKNQLRIENVLALGPKRSLYVVQFLNRRLLLGVTDHQINLLLELDTQDDKKPQDFEELLSQAKSD